MNDFLESLKLDYEAQIKKAEANIKIYMKNPAGIGEHPDIVTECSKLIKDIAEARELASTVNSLIETSNNQNK